MERSIKKGPGKVLEIIELFDATPERVFKAWTNKKDFMSWYGPEGFTVPFCEIDVRVGGAWRACIKSPQGEEYWMQGKYLELTSPSRLVFTYEDGSGKPIMSETVVTINFNKVGNKTEMVFRQTNFPTEELRDSHFGGWSSAFKCMRKFITGYL
jgi:uncharacterized protein YndB with AHSA1/START domain